MTSARALACAMAVAMRCRCVAERQPQTKSCTAVETIDLTCGLHVETMMVSKSWSVVSQDQIIEQTRPLAVALASFPALRSGTGSALRSTQPVVTARPAPELIVIRGGFVQRAAAVARATSRAAYQCRAPRDTRTRDATRGHAPKRVLYAVPPARVARLALGFANRRGGRGAAGGGALTRWSTFGHLYVGAGHTRFLTLHTSGQSPHRTVIRPRPAGRLSR